MPSLNALSSHLQANHRHNVQTIRSQPLSELSGSLGDLGTLLPLLIALTLTGSISLSSTLVFTGIANILTGIFFGIPLPVQPMKAIAAVAIAQQYTVRDNMAAGLTVAGAVGLLSITGAIGLVSKVVPVPVVKGIQVGAGLSLVLSAGTSLLQPLRWTMPTWADNYIWAIGAFLFLLLSTTLTPRLHIPFALLTLTVGILLSMLSNSRAASGLPFTIWHPQLILPIPLPAFTKTLSASLGQLPLTTLNSIIAVSHLSADLFPNHPAGTPSPTSIGISVAAMNIIACMFGSMPACHGSGGLAAQYRFGARSGASVIMLGVVKLVLGLFVNEAVLVGVLKDFPKSLLGIMVIAAGVELAKVGESLNAGAKDLWEVNREEEGEGRKQRELNEEERKERWSVMMVTVAGLLAFKNDGVGFLAGLVWHWGLRLPECVATWRRRGYMLNWNATDREVEPLLRRT